VYGIPDHDPIVEDDPLSGVGPYGRSKIEAEAACTAARAHGLCVPILRPKTFIGPERLGVFELLYDWAAQGRSFPVLGRGDNRYQLLDVEDLCELIVRCVERDAGSVDQIFNVGAIEFGTMREIVQTVLDRAGHGRHAVSLPAAPAVVVLRALRALGLSPLYPWIYETATRDSFVSVERAERALGFKPQHSNRSALERNFDWYVAHRTEYAGRCGISHRVPWQRGALSLVRYLF
jgi:nucleoside-diphosphate-sugar epimerase